MPDLAVILERCLKGDALAWEALVRRFQSRIFGLAYFYLRDREEARDLVQETFVRIYKNLHKFAGADSFVACAGLGPSLLYRPPTSLEKTDGPGVDGGG